LRILALDPGASFGWALSNTALVSVNIEFASYYLPNYPARIGDTPCTCGAWDLSNIKDAGERYNLLSHLIGAQEFLDAIFFEVAPGLIGTAARRWHGGYMGIVQRIAHQLSIPFGTVHPNVWKKFAIGSGNADKAAIRSTAEKRWHLQPEAPEQDAADALGILCWGLQVCEVERAVS